MTYEHLLLTTYGPITTVTLNRADKRNALALTGDAIDAATAADWGLINKAVSQAQLEVVTLDLIQRATHGSALSKALGKPGFYHQGDLPQGQAYNFAVERMATESLLPDSQEGIAAFLEKRVANYVQLPDTKLPGDLKAQ